MEVEQCYSMARNGMSSWMLWVLKTWMRLGQDQLHIKRSVPTHDLGLSPAVSIIDDSDKLSR